VGAASSSGSRTDSRHDEVIERKRNRTTPGTTPIARHRAARADRLTGGHDRDVLEGGAGDDFIIALDGQRDVIRCGSGHDRVVRDAIDVVRGCEESV
jgi:Ca2+-binding RTX toxin-like protein